MRLPALLLALVASACRTTSPAPAAPTPAAATATPPPPATSPCDDVALEDMRVLYGWNKGTAKVINATQYDTMLRPVYVMACAEDGWTADEIACWNEPGDVSTAVRCRQRLSKDHQAKLDASMDRGIHEDQTPDDARTFDPTGIAACDDYLEHLRAFLSCQALSDDDRRYTSTIVTMMAHTWHRARTAHVADRTHRAFEAACRRGLPMLAEAAHALGCS